MITRPYSDDGYGHGHGGGHRSGGGAGGGVSADRDPQYWPREIPLVKRLRRC